MSGWQFIAALGALFLADALAPQSPFATMAAVMVGVDIVLTCHKERREQR